VGHGPSGPRCSDPKAAIELSDSGPSFVRSSPPHMCRAGEDEGSSREQQLLVVYNGRCAGLILSSLCTAVSLSVLSCRAVLATKTWHHLWLLQLYCVLPLPVLLYNHAPLIDNIYSTLH